MEMKRSEGVMDFFENLFMDNQDNIMSYNFKQDNKVNTTNTTNNNSTEPLSDWLRISSPLFKSSLLFPPILLRNDSTIKVTTDEEYFRINYAIADKPNTTQMPPNNTFFYFRLSDTHLYYSTGKDDMNVLGAIDIKSINSTRENDDMAYPCFDIIDTEIQNKWKLCANDYKTMRKWICAIKKVLNVTDLLCTPDALAKVNQPVIVIDEKIIQPIILIPTPSKQCNEKWNYNSHGADWNCICSEGREQSPIDLPDKKKAITAPITPIFQYEIVAKKSPITTLDGEYKTGQYIKIKYFANALRIFHPNMGKIVTLDGAVYVAEEIVFHTPSEHTINGKRYPLEIQIIHYGQTKGDIAKQAVLSFLFEKKAGVYNKFIDDIDFFNLPNMNNPERDIINDLFIPKILYSTNDDNIPEMKPFSFYTYQGSLSFPPCTERTIHYVASEPIPIASVPLQLIQEAIRVPDMEDDKGNYYSSADETANNRDTQPVNDRSVFFFDHKKYCGPEVVEAKPAKPSGHYEKVKRRVTDYIYVNSNTPSGLPNSFIVPENEAKGNY
jgi:carbonic anhydrase